jgi:hypothetical protein
MHLHIERNLVMTQVQVLTLESVAIAALDELVVVRLAASDAVVLGRTPDGTVEAWSDGTVGTFPPTSNCKPLTDPIQAEAVLAQALAGLNVARRAAVRATCEQTARHTGLLDEIRSYAVETHLSGSICRDGLNRFLHHFDLAEYLPYCQVSYTIAGTCTVDVLHEDAVRTRLTETLAPNLTEVDAVLSGSADHQVEIQCVTPVELGYDCRGLQVTFTVTGSYEVDDDDCERAERDGETYLRLEATGLVGPVPGSLTYQVAAICAEPCD